MSVFARLTDSSRTSRHVRFVPTTEVALTPLVTLLCAAPQRTWPYLPVGEVLEHPEDWKSAARDRSGAGVPSLSALVPAVRRVHGLPPQRGPRPRHPVDPAMPFPPTTPLRHTGHRTSERRPP